MEYLFDLGIRSGAVNETNSFCISKLVRKLDCVEARLCVCGVDVCECCGRYFECGGFLS